MQFYKPELGEPFVEKIFDLSKVDWRNGMIVRSTNWLGDAVMTVPAVYKLSQLLPEGKKMMVLTKKALSSLWKAYDFVDEVIEMEDKRITPEAAKRMAELNPGVAVVLPNSFGSAKDLFGKGIPVRIGRKGRGRGLLLTHKLPGWYREPGKDTHHQLREYLQLAKACGSSEWNADCPPADPGVSDDRLNELGFDLSKKWLVLAPGAKFGPAKQWPVEYHREIAQWWTKEHGRVAVMGAPDEQETCSAVAEGIEGAVSFAGKTSVSELMAILGKAAASVVNDSGAMHLAAAMGGGGVAVFGSTEEIATGPVGGRWYILNDRLDCAPCLQRTCEVAGRDYDCLKGITPERVKKCLEDLI